MCLYSGTLRENSPFDARNGSSFTPSQTLFLAMLALNLLVVQYTSQRSIRHEDTPSQNVRTTTDGLRFP